MNNILIDTQTGMCIHRMYNQASLTISNNLLDWERESVMNPDTKLMEEFESS